MHWHHKLLILSLVAVIGCVPAEGNWPSDLMTCTEMGCSDRLEITIERFDGQSFNSGDYSFIFSPSSGSAIELDCTVDSSFDLECTGDVGAIEFEAENSFTQFVAVIHFAPPSVDVEVRLNNQLIGAETLSPDYTIFTPNGPECEPTCLQSAVVVKVSSSI